MKYTSKLILNGEEYLFAAPSGGPLIIEDDFSGNTLDTNIWTATQCGGKGTYTVNNGLSMDNQGGRGGYVIFTNKTFTGTENTITVEATITAEGGSYKESKYGILGKTWFTYENLVPYLPGYDPYLDVYHSGSGSFRIAVWNNDGSAQPYTNDVRYVSISYPYTIKLVLDVSSWSVEVFRNGTSLGSKQLYGTSTDAIGMPLFSIDDVMWTGCTCSLSYVKITIE